MTNYDYSEFTTAKVGDNILAAIRQEAQRQQDAEQAVVELTESLDKAEKHLRHISEVSFPELMEEAQIQTLNTEDGLSIELTEKIRSSIPVDLASQAFAWLEEHDFGNIIKRQVILEFGKDEEKKAQEAVKLLKSHGFHIQIKKTVHPQTLGAFVRDCLANGIAIPTELFGVFRQRLTKIKRNI